jgi:hypothetical protein
MKALISGATGFIGSQLTRQLDRPVVLSRNPEAAKRGLGDVEAHAWNYKDGPPPRVAFEGVDAVIHLAGESVGEGRWNARKKAAIRESRVLSTRRLVDAIGGLDRKPSVFVCASAIGIYGSRGEDTLDESAAPGDDFLAKLGVEWEREAARAEESGVRTVSVRTGLVLGRGGALGKMLPIFKLGLGGPLGNGKQWMSWIHIDDLVGLFLHAVNANSLRGAMNGVAPNPVRNSEFTKALGRALHRPAFFPAPAFGLRLGIGEFADALLASQRVTPGVALRTGYAFKFPEIDGALADVV